MIYESVYILKQNTTDEQASKVRELISSAITEAGGEQLVNDDWGIRQFAQPTDKGERIGFYNYVMFKAEGTIITEIERRLKINENVIKWLIVKLGTNEEQDNIVKAYKNPNHESTEGTDDPKGRDRRMMKGRSCFFTTNKTTPDWKNPKTYVMFVNEFGKVSAARVSGLRPRFQRKVTTAIKRGRMMGLISHLSNETSSKVSR